MGADLQAYISSYTSHTKIDRLLYIAEHHQGQPLELEALKLAADEVKQVCPCVVKVQGLGYASMQRCLDVMMTCCINTAAQACV